MQRSKQHGQPCRMGTGSDRGIEAVELTGAEIVCKALEAEGVEVVLAILAAP